MIHEHFHTLDRDDDSRYFIEQTAQIEPCAADDPDELYRMRMERPQQQDLVFDAVFYPDRVDIQTVAGHTVGEIKGTVSNLEDELDRFEPYLTDALVF